MKHQIKNNVLIGHHLKGGANSVLRTKSNKKIAFIIYATRKLNLGNNISGHKQQQQ